MPKEKLKNIKLLFDFLYEEEEFSPVKKILDQCMVEESEIECQVAPEDTEHTPSYDFAANPDPILGDLRIDESNIQN